MVLMPIDAIKDRRHINQGYQKVDEQPPPDALTKKKHGYKKTPAKLPPPPPSQEGTGWRRDFKL